MALADLTIADATPTNQTFRLAATTQGKTVYSDSGTTIMEPRLLTIAHTLSGKNEKRRVRSLVRFDVTKVDTDGITSDTASVYLVMDRPSRIVESSDVSHLIAMLKNVLTSGNVTTLLAGQQL